MFLDDRDRQLVMELLTAHAPDLEIWAFGSRVHGRRLKPFSDLDLAVVAPVGVDPGRLARLRELFTESDLPFRTDVMDLTCATPGVRAAIEAEHEVLVRQPALVASSRSAA